MRFLVIEHYPYGDSWEHWFDSKLEAEWQVQKMHEAHPYRTYEFVGAVV